MTVQKFASSTHHAGHEPAEMAVQVMQQEQEVLCVSQFTLFNVLKGNKPDFHLAMQPEQVCITHLSNRFCPSSSSNLLKATVSDIG